MDRLQGFNDLVKKMTEGRDYRRVLEVRSSSVAVIAPHGGGIEPGTSEVACAIAGKDLSLYCFEGLGGAGNHSLHLTSTRFDDSACVDLVTNSRVVVAVHGCIEHTSLTYIGGTNEILKAAVSRALEEEGFIARADNGRFAGQSRRNICNRGGPGRSVQLELAELLRESFFSSLDLAGRSQPTPLFFAYTHAIRQALIHWDVA
jgi:phage replication-related protein YjqB (UPF0714/DUF867 family)